MPDDPLTARIIRCAIDVHRHLGPGLLESAYQACLAAELAHQGIAFRAQVPVDLVYRGVRVPGAYRLDLLVEEAVVVELKAVSEVTPVHRAQILSYLRLTGYKRGLLLNFHQKTLIEGLTRFALDHPDHR